MSKIGLRLVERSDGVEDRGRAEAEPGDLREDEPHPVRPLLASHELPHDRVIDGRLGVDEALEVERVGHLRKLRVYDPFG